MQLLTSIGPGKRATFNLPAETGPQMLFLRRFPVAARVAPVGENVRTTC
jgi:hypothetical protein